MKIGSLKEFKELETMDFTVNGKCSNCGECCSTLLPVSDDEIKQIRQYIRKHHVKLKHNVKAPMAARTIDLTCPFLDVSKEHKGGRGIGYDCYIDKDIGWRSWSNTIAWQPLPEPYREESVE